MLATRHSAPKPQPRGILRIVARVFIAFLGLAILSACSGQPAVPNTEPLAQRGLTVLSSVTGNVLVQVPGGSWSTGVVGQALDSGSKVRTEADAKATITFFEGSTIDLEASTEIEISTLTSKGPANIIKLKQQIGQTMSHVKKLADPGSAYDVETAATVASVRGTTLYVAVAANGTTVVGNVEGSVSVTAQGVTVAVPVGKSVEVTPGQPPSAPGPLFLPIELSHDDGAPDGGYSTGGRNEYGFLVRFTPPDASFKINRIRVFSWIVGVPPPGSQFTLRVADKALNQLWQVSLPMTDFPASHSWLAVAVPDVSPGGDFCIEIYAPTLGQGLGPFIGVDESQPNQGSELTSAWQIIPWNAQMPKEQCNWMIRADGQYSPPAAGP